MTMRVLAALAAGVLALGGCDGDDGACVRDLGGAASSGSASGSASGTHHASGSASGTGAASGSGTAVAEGEAAEC